MGILKKIDSSIKKCEKKYDSLKKDTVGLRRIGGKIFDTLIPPPKKSKNKSINDGY